MENKKEYKGYGLLIVLDKDEIDSLDPDIGTPAMVYRVNELGEKTHSATYWDAIGKSELQPVDLGMFCGKTLRQQCSVRHLSEKQVDWLQRYAFEIEDFLYN
jgi:hypothetical protein